MARVLVTGASRGIGRATVEELARRGHEVVATARQPEALADLPAALRLRMDVTDAGSVAEAAREAGPVDALVNNAGEFFLAPVETSPMAETRALFELNVFGALRTIQAFAPGMREAGRGTIVNVSSFAGRGATPLGGVYGATKFALEGLSESLRFELGHFGVRVVLIEPGTVQTDALARAPKFFAENDPYGPLAAQLQLTLVTPPEGVARAVADAIEAPDPQLRWPVGPDAEAFLGARAKLDDAAFDQTLRAAFSLTW